MEKNTLKVVMLVGAGVLAYMLLKPKVVEAAPVVVTPPTAVPPAPEVPWWIFAPTALDQLINIFRRPETATVARIETQVKPIEFPTWVV